MRKGENTLIRLEDALQRILSGIPRRISKNRTLSIRAVEEEANLGNGSCYYYSEFASKVRQLKNNNTNHEESSSSDLLSVLREKIAFEKRIKEKYKNEKSELKITIEQLTAQHHEFNELIRRYCSKITQLEIEKEELAKNLLTIREELAQLKRTTIAKLNNSNR